MAPRVVEFAPVQTSGSDVTSSSDSDDYHQDNTPTPVKASEASATAPRKRKLKSGRVRTANSHVKTVTSWPHEVVYDALNQAQEFDKLTITQFVKGFCKITRTRDTQRAEIRTIVLEEIMEDAETHPWELVRAAHAILLQQIESGRASWEDKSNRQDIRVSHIHWPAQAAGRRASKPAKAAATFSTQAAATPSTSYGGGNTAAYTAPPPTYAEAGDKACRDYNRRGCRNAAEHPEYIHCCDYCLRTKGRICKHSGKYCNRRGQDAALNG
jgi:hypothetical protein